VSEWCCKDKGRSNLFGFWVFVFLGLGVGGGKLRVSSLELSKEMSMSKHYTLHSKLIKVAILDLQKKKKKTAAAVYMGE
jgi:hypothetical protein